MSAGVHAGVRSPYTVAYGVLRDAQRRFNRRLTIAEVQEFFESTPEVVFAPRTTVQEALSKLQRWQLVNVEDQLVDVVDAG